MEHPIVEKIMKEGISSVNLSMLDNDAKKRIMDDVAEKLLKEGRYKETIEIMSMNREIARLLEIGDIFLSEGKSELATLFYIPTKDKQKLNNAALLCIQNKNYELASRAYEAADNRQMASFIRENFG